MAKPNTTESAMTRAIMPSVRSMSPLMAPEASNVHSVLAISDGGMMVLWLIRPSRQASSSAPIMPR